MANCVFGMTKLLRLYISSLSPAIAGKHGKHHAMRAHKPQAVSDWLNPRSLGTMIKPSVALKI